MRIADLPSSVGFAAKFVAKLKQSSFFCSSQGTDPRSKCFAESQANYLVLNYLNGSLPKISIRFSDSVFLTSISKSLV